MHYSVKKFTNSCSFKWGEGMDIFKNWNGKDQHIIICPFCRCEQVHLIGIQTFPVFGELLIEISKSEIKTSKNDKTIHNRGINHHLTFICEDGHCWKTEMKFHKGFMHIENILIEEISFDEDKSKINDIWKC